MTDNHNTAASQLSERHATLRYERGTPGNENDMPSVVSCNWLPDGDYAVYLAAPQPPAASQPTALSGEGVSDEQIACWVQESQSVCWSDTEQARYVIDRALAAVRGKK